MRITLRIDIEAPPEVVWACIEKPDNRQCWMPEVLDIEYPAGYDMEDPVGTRFRHIVREGGRKRILFGDIVACEDNRSLELLISDVKCRTDVTFELQPIGTGTRVTYGVDTGPGNGVQGALAKLARPLRARALSRHLENLRQFAEDTAAGIRQRHVLRK